MENDRELIKFQVAMVKAEKYIHTIKSEVKPKSFVHKLNKLDKNACVS